MKRGFTLIELLIVISIISILTFITAGQFQTAKKKANDVARKGDLNSFSKALQMYYADFGVFPDPTLITWGGTFEDATMSPPYIYMKKLPKENSLATPYCYKISLDGKKYGLFANLESRGDNECSHTYVCDEVEYCYGVVSPNSSLTSNGTLE